jgi:hypothetical protein
MLMSRLRFPTPTSTAAITVYAQNRPPSYGSYFVEYYRHYGDDGTDIKNRMDAGIAGGWGRDVSGPFGAVRWYHRAATGANPALAELYGPIIEAYIK